MQDTFTYEEVLQAHNAAMQLGMVNVPQKTAYRLSRIIDRLNSAVKTITKEKIELYKEHGQEVKPGSGDYKIPDDKMTEFQNKVWIPFMEKTIEIEYMGPIAVNMFPQLPANAIIGMGKFMIEEEKIISNVR